MLPLAQKTNMLIVSIDDEVMVYDEKRHYSHVLNHVTALVWQNCDGHTSIGELVIRLKQEIGSEVNEELVWEALGMLSKANLLTQPIERPGNITRRSFAKGAVKAAAVLIPLICSIAAPTAAEASSSCSTTSSLAIPQPCDG